MRDIPNFEGLYAVTSCGKVWSYRSKRFLKPSWSHSNSGKDWEGYLQVTLMKDGKKHYMKVHRAVALTYIPNPNNLPETDHINGDRRNNSVNNLQWITKEANLMKREGLKKRVKCEENGKIYESINAAARELGLDSGSISKVCRGIMKQTKGYHFTFVINEEG